MGPLKIRFEQKRGHFMIIEGDPPLSRETVNETQLRMLKSCEIPGLLPVETEELNSHISLRYALSGTRMLSESMRTSKWSMAEMMAALCRVSEVLEECRLYLLDADRIKLEDEFIFVGSDWHDLRFTYIPFDLPALDKEDDLEKLVIRWMLKVTDLDGAVMQSVLRVVASVDFVPAILRTYTRQYLAGVVKEDQPILSVRNEAVIERRNHSALKHVSKEYVAEPPLGIGMPAKKAQGWGIFQPPSGDLQSVSQLLGDDSEPWVNSIGFHGAPQDITENDRFPMEKGRWRTVISCAAVLLAALAWRYIYSGNPGQQRLLICVFVTLADGAALLYLWNGLPLRSKKDLISPVHEQLPNESNDINSRSRSAEYDDDRDANSRFAIDVSPDLSVTAKNQGHPLETTWLHVQEDLTGLLTNEKTPRLPNCYLVCETDDTGNRVALHGNSLVIGRSSEAAQHVDVSKGISRAHVEFLKVSDQWKVKDLGSRNGSWLNDQAMAPYQLYPIQDGDRLVLANARYRFVQEK